MIFLDRAKPQGIARGEMRALPNEKVVDRVQGLTVFELRQLLDQQIGVQGVGVVKIHLGSLCKRQFTEVPIIAVMCQGCDMLPADSFYNGLCNRRFPGSCTPGDADD